MRGTGTLQSDHLIASGCVVLVHLLLAWMLARLLHVVPMAATPQDDAIRIEFLPRRPQPPAAPPAATPRQRPLARVMAATPPPTAPVPAPTPAGDTPPATAPTVVLIEQARQWAQEQAAQTPPAPADPFVRRTPLPPPPPERFRMREPMSVKRVVDAVGAAFAGPAYERDPCPRNRDNIAALAVQGDGAALQHDIDFERRHCRP